MEKILIVEDDDGIRDMLSEVMKVIKFEAVIAENGEVGLEKFRSQSFSLIITDIKMPVMDGLTMLKTIRKENSDIPIIVITAFPSVDSAIECLAHGADYYIVKPININDLEIKISKSIEKIKLRHRVSLVKRVNLIMALCIPIWIIVGFFLARLF